MILIPFSNLKHRQEIEVICIVVRCIECVRTIDQAICCGNLIDLSCLVDENQIGFSAEDPKFVLLSIVV